MDRETHQIYAFGDYRLDVARRALTRSTGELVELKPKVFDLLRYLVEHAGELVEKKPLLAAVWPGVVVEEHNLNKTVSVLRRTLGDDPEAQEYIATIPGRGYQFVHAVSSRVAPERARTAEVNASTRSSTSWRWLIPIAIAITGAAAAGVWLWQDESRTSSIDGPPIYALLDTRPAERLDSSNASQRPSRTAVRLSPDGRTLVFAGVRTGVPQLFKRRLEDPQATAIPGTEGATAPFFSPDGEWVGFWQAGRFRRYPLAGGPPVDIGAVDGGEEVGPMGVSWGANGRIVYSMPRLGGIWSIPADGGTAERVTPIGQNDDQRYRLPYVLPDGHAMVFTVTTGLRTDDPTRLVMHRFDTDEQRVLLDDAADARYVSSGHLLFMRRGTLMAVPFDLARGEVTGTPIAVIDDVMQAINQPNGLDETFAGQFDVADRNLVFLPGGSHPPLQHQLVWTDREGAEAPFALDPGSLFTPRWSPNGKLVAYVSAGTGLAAADIWVYDVDRRTSRRVTFDGGSWPLWSDDGERLVFAQPPRGLRSIAVDESGPPTLVPVSSNLKPAPSSWVGSTLLTVELSQGVYSEIWSLSMERPDRATPLMQRAYMLQAPALSPDGRWLAYVSWETGTPDVYVQRYPEGDETVRVSMTGGMSPRWTRSGRELVFTRSKDLDVIEALAVAVDTSDGFRFEPPRVLFEGPYSQTVPAHGYDVSPDGQTFIMAKRVSGEPFVTMMHLVLDWQTELESRVRRD